MARVANAETHEDTESGLSDVFEFPWLPIAHPRTNIKGIAVAIVVTSVGMPTWRLLFDILTRKLLG